MLSSSKREDSCSDRRRKRNERRRRSNCRSARAEARGDGRVWFTREVPNVAEVSLLPATPAVSRRFRTLVCTDFPHPPLPFRRRVSVKISFYFTNPVSTRYARPRNPTLVLLQWPARPHSSDDFPPRRAHSFRFERPTAFAPNFTHLCHTFICIIKLAVSFLLSHLSIDRINLWSYGSFNGELRASRR